MDRVNNEWIMDAVTHQPLGKQVAIKDDDGVFYWDLNVKQAVTPGGVLPQQTQYVGNMRQSYDEWYQGMKDQWLTLKENNPTMQSMLQARSKHLVKTTRPKNLRSWLRMTNLKLIHDIRRAQNEKERELERGEVRLEIKSSRLNEIGLRILAAMGPEFAAGDALVLAAGERRGEPRETAQRRTVPRRTRGDDAARDARVDLVGVRAANVVCLEDGCAHMDIVKIRVRK
jgi:hypothetical protein